MAFAPGLRSVGGAVTGVVPFCTYPTFVNRTGSGDLTSNNGTFSFNPNPNTTPYGMITNPIHFTQDWCEAHSGNHAGTFGPGAEWTDFCQLPIKYNGQSGYVLAIQLGLWQFTSSNPHLLQIGMRGEIRRLSDSARIKLLPTANNPNGFQQQAWFGDSGLNGVVVSPQIVLYNGAHYLTFSCASNTYRYDVNIFVYGGGFSLNIDNTSVWAPSGYVPYKWIIDDPNDVDPEDDDREGGGGDHNPHYDPVPVPTLPTISPLSGGAFNAFSLTETELRQFNSDLYDPDAWQALKNFFADPMEFLMGCMMVPVSPPTLGTLYPYFPVAGHAYTWPHAYRRITDEFKEVSCGSIFIKEYYGSCFDYSPYTKIDLWLPFVGFVHLDPDEVMNTTIDIKYHVDVMTGACVAIVSIGVVGQLGPQIPRVIGEFNGNCGMQVPVSKANFDNAIASAFQLCAAVATAAGVAVAGGASIGAMEAAGASEAAIASREIGLTAQVSSRLGAATMSAVAGSKAGVTKSGGIGGPTGFLGVLKPYVVIHTPRQSKPSNYKDLKGYPSNIGGVVGDFTGYLEVSDVRLNNIPATVREIEEIYNLLKGGILL